MSQSLEPIENAEVIISVQDENGNIIDSGKHDYLIKESSVYQKLYNLQFKTSNE